MSANAQEPPRAAGSASPALPDFEDERVRELAESLGLTRSSLERLQELRDEVHETLTEEFNIVASDLGQLRRILSDAAEKLSGTFRVVTANSDELRRTIGRMDEMTCEQALPRIREIAADMASTTGQTVQSLQFEDMATQLLQHVDRKLEVLARFSKEMAIINPTTEHVPPLLKTDQLDQLFERLQNYRNELTVSARKVVQQTSLDSGDIELF